MVDKHPIPDPVTPPEGPSRKWALKEWVLHPVASIALGAVLGTIIGLAGGGVLGGIASGVLGSLATFYIQVSIKQRESLKWTRDATQAIVGNVRLAEGLKQLLVMAQTLPLRHTEVYACVMSHVAERGGAIVIRAEERHYLEYLQKLLSKSRDSFLATLRGGESPRFNLDWFFDSSPSLSTDQRFGWLEAVRDSNIQTKIRLLVFSENKTNKFFLQRQRREELLRAMLERKKGDPGRVYQVAPASLMAILGVSWGDEESRIIYDDYAIFDGEIVLKHNGAASLIVSIRDQIQAYREVFNVISLRQDIFKELTLTHYGSETWNEWSDKHSSGVST